MYINTIQELTTAGLVYLTAFNGKVTAMRRHTVTSAAHQLDACNKNLLSSHFLTIKVCIGNNIFYNTRSNSYCMQRNKSELWRNAHTFLCMNVEIWLLLSYFERLFLNHWVPSQQMVVQLMLKTQYWILTLKCI